MWCRKFARQLLPCLLLLMAKPTPGVAATVSMTLDGLVDLSRMELEVLRGSGSAGAPYPQATLLPPPMSTFAQLWDSTVTSAADLKFEHGSALALTATVESAVEDDFGTARATAGPLELLSALTLFVDTSSREGYSAVAYASQVFGVALHGAGILLVTAPFSLEGSFDAADLGQQVPTHTLLRASLYAEHNARGDRAVLGGHSNTISLAFDSGRTGLQQQTRTGVLALAIPFEDGDTLRITVGSEAAATVDLRPVPVPGVWPVLGIALACLGRYAVRRSFAPA